MAIKLIDLRFMTERQTKTPLDNDDFLLWANEVNADIGMNFDLPSTTTIELNTTDIEYPLPNDLKIINRMRLQSIVDQGLDAEFRTQYRIYNGNIVLSRVLWISPDNLIIDYYKHLTTFTSIDDLIEFDDRYAPLYTLYALVKYYEMPETIQSIGEQAALRKLQSSELKYKNLKIQLTAYQTLSIEPVVIDGRW